MLFKEHETDEKDEENGVKGDEILVFEGLTILAEN